MKRIIALILVIVLLSSSLFSCDTDDKTDEYGIGASDYYYERNNTNRQVTYIEMCIYNYGKIVFCLDYTAAPKTVEQFVGLANGGYYSDPPENPQNVYGNRIHAIKPGTYIQGGCHAGDGSGALNNRVVGEFSENGHRSNDLLHKKGVISLARENHNDSGSCQFFICYTDMPELNGHYAAFGYVVEGMSVLDDIMGDLAGYADEQSFVLPVEYQPRIKYVRLYEKWPEERGGV